MCYNSKLMLTMKLTMKFLSSLLVLLVVNNFETTHCEDVTSIPSLSECGKVHLTVSSVDKYLEMNWVADCDTLEEAPDQIALYNQNPRSVPVRPLWSINAHHHEEGYYLTAVEFRPPWLPGEWDYYENISQSVPGPIPGPHCFPYWIASIKKSRIIDLNCLKINPTWMDDNRSVLGSQRIGAIFIPGTHNSGAYGSQPSFMEKVILNQDRDIWTQLVFGIRYLDLRIGYYYSEGFYINHDLVRITRLKPVLRMIREFLEVAPKEIVIVDFHRFPYPSRINNGTHRKLIRLIENELGDFALPPSGLQVGKGPTLNEIWQHKKNVIICYGQRQMAKEYPWLWNPLPQHWGDKKDVGDLKKFLLSAIKSHSTVLNPLWALMAELTISPLDLIFGSTSNKHLADKVNKELTIWFRDEWADEANIVATDYFLGNDLINVAIEANKLR